MTTKAIPAHGRTAPALRMLAVAAVALALVVPAAAEARILEAADVAAERAIVDAAATATGGVGELFVGRTAGIDAPNPEFSLHAGKVVAEQVTTTYDEAVVGGLNENTAGYLCEYDGYATPNCPVRQSSEHVGATVALTGSQKEYLFNLFSQGAEPAASISMTGGMTGPITNPYLTPAGLDEPADPNTRSSTGANTWTRPVLPGPHVLTTPSDGRAVITLDGDFVVEVMGVDLLVSTAAGSRSLHSGSESDALAPGTPDAVTGVIHQRTDDFVRLTVTAGHLEMTEHAADAVVKWAGKSATIGTNGPVTLQGARGALVFADGSTGTQQGSALRMNGPYGLALSPQDSALRVKAQRIDVAAGPSVAVGMPDNVMLLLAAVSLGLASIGAVAFVLLRRRRHPGLADVEAAIEAGHYRRAASDAGRILRRRPGMEDALLSRAIALAKAGKPARVVTELQAHLARKAPSDGSLHYVLGMAYLDLGQRQEAEAVFSEALRRTPSLLTDVQARLGVPGTTSRTPPPLQGAESTHAYA